ncbi:MAG: hypothetical protein L3J59_12490 [Methylococcaceae bacterium]|nr:hypothetical protein [Methylococcaceae bacterium]
MRQPKTALVFLLLAIISFSTLAEDAEYNADSKILTIPTVKVPDGYIYDVKLKLNSLEGLTYLKHPSSDSLKTECSKENLTAKVFNQITNGMTLAQASHIVGCKAKLNLVSSERFLYKWVGVKNPIVPKISIQVENNIVVHKSFSPSK